MPATWQPRPVAESLHIITLTHSYGKENRREHCRRTVGFLQKLSTIDDVTKYRGIPVSRYFWDGILSSGCSVVFFAPRRYASAIYAVIVSLSVRPSVCLSAISRSSAKMAKLRITKATLYDSPGNLAFWGQKSRRNSDGITPNRGAK